MELFNKIMNREEKIAVVGLGYVGMPLAVEFSKHVEVIGFDINSKKIDQYRNGIDVTNEVGDEAITNCTVYFTSEEVKLGDAKFFVVAVPTPISADKTPDLTPVVKASELIGRYLSVGSYVVYESTVYPGVTEDICIPILEEQSGLKCGLDFKIGYSPERINPGDQVHRLDTIIKVVSGMDEESLELIAKVYEIVAKAGVHKAGSIKVAEAAKVAENSQRDINIAFMNELSMVFDKMGINTFDVIKAMNTKWNALGFYPGLVGGHCIGVDPYYFIYKAEQLGYHSQIILSGRKINDDMGKYVAHNIIKKIIRSDIPIKDIKIAVLGITFKENCPDVRNTKTIDIIKELVEYGLDVLIYDPIADEEEVFAEYSLKLANKEQLTEINCIVLAVAHNELCEIVKSEDHLNEIYAGGTRMIVDIKSVLDREKLEEQGYIYWSL